MVITLQRIFSEESALEVAGRAYGDLRDRLLAVETQPLRAVIESVSAQGLALLDSLTPKVTSDKLSEGEQNLMDSSLLSMSSDDVDQMWMWLGLFPESVERLLVGRTKALRFSAFSLLAILEWSAEVQTATTFPKAGDWGPSRVIDPDNFSYWEYPFVV